MVVYSPWPLKIGQGYGHIRRGMFYQTSVYLTFRFAVYVDNVFKLTVIHVDSKLGNILRLKPRFLSGNKLISRAPFFHIRAAV